MPMTPQRQSATIYQFPVGGLKGLNSWKTAPDVKVETPASPVIIDSWYHEAAMNETKPQ
ncbi:MULTISPECIES: DUF2735 domain-containing protein [unclassified Rhizobium]|uniref:DUF2735 domain-containing protein n=1 Tax=unclassified Rhizobium TaxID=2613769 RepID=UPI000B29AFBA|nr:MULTISPECIES: DUF2735 domain-containing protein [unclassified Rhizobium]TCM58721.1 uncharacterized protein DUF2735 [Rhizobium sp. PP-F2F-G48]